MWGFSKIEKNEKAIERAQKNVDDLPKAEKVQMLKRLRRKHPNYHQHINLYDDIGDILLDPDFILLYLLFMDEEVVSEMAFEDNIEVEQVEELPSPEEEVAVIASEGEPVMENTTNEDIPDASTQPDTQSYTNETPSYDSGSSDCDSGDCDCGD